MKNNSALYFLSFSIFALALSLLISSGDTAQLKANDEFKQYYNLGIKRPNLRSNAEFTHSAPSDMSSVPSAVDWSTVTGTPEH
jgi:hypothetical protein